IRQHGNLIENAALTLFVIGVVELNGGSDQLVHALGATFVIARIAHPLGLKAESATHPLRAIGAGLSQLVLLIAGGVAAWQFVSGGPAS
ncbi:MAG: MAPEG family protein, partial [Pseudomonadota bacterium]